MKTIEPLYTERYVQWCGRSATQLMGSLLPDLHDNRFAGEACNLLFMNIESSHNVLSAVLKYRIL